MKTIKLFALLFISTILFTGCSEDDDHSHDHGGDEEELITTVTYTLTNGNDVVTLKFQDLDGLGGADGTYDVSGPFTANTTYTGILKLENETENPAEDITEEVRLEDDEHELFYTASIAGVSITKTDVDRNGNPLGIETSLTTGSATNQGTLTITLKHEPTKPNDGTEDGAGGSTDVQVTFADLTVQ